MLIGNWERCACDDDNLRAREGDDDDKHLGRNIKY